MAEERKTKGSIQLEGSIQDYSFKATEHDDFTFTLASSETISGTVDLYWKQNNAYMLSNYKSGEEVEMAVLENDRQSVFRTTFYSMTGFSFEGVAGRKYRVLFMSKGSIEKLVLFKLSRTMGSSEHIAKKDKLMVSEAMLQRVILKIKVGLAL